MNQSLRSFLGLTSAILATLIAGLSVGLIVGFLSTIVYIVFLFPLGMGFSAGFFLEKTIAWTKIRKVSQATLLGSLMVIAVYGGYKGIDYAFFVANSFLKCTSKF